MKYEFGVYMSKSGRLHYFYKDTNPEGKVEYFIDSGEYCECKYLGFSLRYPVVSSMTPGYPLELTLLKKCEYLGEL